MGFDKLLLEEGSLSIEAAVQRIKLSELVVAYLKFESSIFNVFGSNRSEAR